jgi:hypothetical protein
MIKICHSGKNPTVRYLNRTREVGVSWLVEVFEIDGINIYKVDAKLRAADIGAKRIACVDTWQSNCVLINPSEPGVDATGQRALLSTLRSNSGRKRWNVLRRAQPLLPARAGGFLNPSSKRRNGPRLTTMTLLPTHAFAAKSDTDCEPAYPCEEFQDVDVWGNDDSGTGDGGTVRCVPCEQIPGQYGRSQCGDDRCVGQVRGGAITITMLATYITHAPLSATLREFNTLAKRLQMTMTPSSTTLGELTLCRSAS